MSEFYEMICLYFHKNKKILLDLNMFYTFSIHLSVLGKNLYKCVK